MRQVESMVTNRSRIQVLLALLLLGALSRGAYGQEVRGRITSQDAREPLVGVFVMLLDSTGARRAAALTDTAGIYRLGGAPPGTFTIAAERLGYSSNRSAPFALPAGSVAVQDLALAVKPVVLPELNVGSGRGCEAPRDRATRIAQFWEEARKALTVALWASAEQMVTYEIVRYSLEFDRDGKRVLREHVEERTRRLTGTPWDTAPAEDLVANGFIQPRPDGMSDIFVPGPEVLLSPVFLSSHCFELRGDRANAMRIGLAFRPVGRPTKPDVTGTIWLDRKSLALQSIEWNYTRAGQRSNMGSGVVEFAYLPSGIWAMAGWRARLPIQPNKAPRGRAPTMIEDGSHVVRALARDSSIIWSAPPQRRVNAKGPVRVDSLIDAETGSGELPILSAAGLAAWDCGPRDRNADRTTEVLGYVGNVRGFALQGVPVRLAWVENEAVRTRDEETDAAGVYIFCGIPVDREVSLSIAAGSGVTRQVTLYTQRGVILTRSFFYQ